jgi:hypothetical protein
MQKAILYTQADEGLRRETTLGKKNLRVVVIDKTDKHKTGPCRITQTPAATRSRVTGMVRKYQTRPWFSANEDELTAAQANNVLTFGRGHPYYDDIFIIIFSLRKGERERFIGDDDAFCQVMRAATIEAMNSLAMAVEADRLIWIARAHPDYPHPCVKVLINRGIVIDGYRWKELKSFPRQVRMHWLKQERPGDPRVTVSGGCGDAFLRVFDAAAQVF